MSATPAIRILLVDDHDVVRAGLIALIGGEEDIRVIGEARTGMEAVEKAKVLLPDLVLMDVNLPDIDGIETSARILHQNRYIRVLFLSHFDQSEYVRRAIQQKASGYVLKTASKSEILSAIRAVHAGNQYFSPQVTQSLVDAYLQENRTDSLQKKRLPLTDRETEILKLIAEGRTNQQVADMFEISIRTVEFHRANVMKKLGVKDQAGLVKYAIREHLVTLGEG